MKVIFKIFVLWIFLMTCKTNNIEYKIYHYSKEEPKQVKNQLLGGIAIVDITPPPTMPLAGYSMNANSANGFRHKLKARIFVLTNKKNHTIVLVQMDLLSGSKLLHHKVAEIISQKYPIRFSDIALFGTHTHAGPGNYYESNFYNK
jgi:neutral ceramidase